MAFIISILVFVMFILGLYSLSNFTLDDLSVDLEEALKNPNISIKKRVIKKQKNQKSNFIIRILEDTKVIMTSMGRSNKFILVVIVSIILSFFGGFLAITFGNPYLIPAMVLGFISIPFIFVRTYSYTYKNHLRSELELSLSQITTSYLRTDDIIKSVEENIDNINPPIKKAFEEFIYQVKYINPNISQAIDDMKEKIDNKIFKEWCDCLKKCNRNRTLKYMLVPVVDKFQTLREIQGAIQQALSEYRIEYFVILLVVYINYPLIYFLNPEWFDVLSTTPQGLACTGFVAFVAVLCTIILSFILKPLEYDI